jgi:hypothetical protein
MALLISYTPRGLLNFNYEYVYHNVWMDYGPRAERLIMASWNPWLRAANTLIRVHAPAVLNSPFQNRVIFNNADPHYAIRPSEAQDTIHLELFYMLIRQAVERTRVASDLVNPPYGQLINYYQIVIRFYAPDGLAMFYRTLWWSRISGQQIHEDEWDNDPIPPEHHGVSRDPEIRARGFVRFQLKIEQMLSEYNCSPPDTNNNKDGRLTARQRRRRMLDNPQPAPQYPAWPPAPPSERCELFQARAVLDTSHIVVHYTDVMPGDLVEDPADSAFIIYDTISHPNSELNCIYEAMRDCGYDFPELRNCFDVYALIDVVEERDVPITIIYNIPLFDETCAGLHKGGGGAKRVKLPGRASAVTFHPLRDEHCRVNVCYAHGNDAEFPPILCLDVDRGHIEMIRGDTPHLRDRVFMADVEIIRYLDDGTRLIVRDWDRHVRPKKRSRTPEEEADTEFIFFSFKTVAAVRDDSFFVPYSCSWMFAPLRDMDVFDELEDDDGGDSEDPEAAALAFTRTYTHHHKGFDAPMHFIESIRGRIAAAAPHVRFIVVSYDSAKFDAFPLLHALHHAYPVTEKPYVDYVEYHGERLGDIHFFGGRCTLWDPARHLPNSLTLAQQCESFGIDLLAPSSLGVSDIDVIRAFYQFGEQGFFASLQQQQQQQQSSNLTDERLRDSNNSSVIATAALTARYLKFMDTFECITAAQQGDGRIGLVYDNVTLPAFLVKIAAYYAKWHGGVPFPKFTFDQSEFFRLSAIAGRIDTFGKPRARYDTTVHARDFASLYPYVMVASPDRFPCGEMTDCASMTDHKRDSLQYDLQHYRGGPHDFPYGFYTVDIDQTALVDNDIPLVVCHKSANGGGNDWDDGPLSTVQTNVVLCSIDIVEAFRVGAIITFKAGTRFIEFSTSTQNFDAFSWLADLMVAKNEQSTWREEGSPQFSKGLYALVKHMLVSVAGKLLQKPMEEVCMQVRKDRFASRLTRTKGMIPGSDIIIGHANRKCVIVQYLKDPLSIDVRRPTHWGVWVYALARAHVHRTLLAPLGTRRCIYMDTDSVKMTAADAVSIDASLSAIVPHNNEIVKYDRRYATHPIFSPNSTVFGSLRDENPPNNTLTIVNAKKETACFTIDPETREILHFQYSLKGVSASSIRINNIKSTAAKEFISIVSDSPGGEIRRVVADQGKALLFTCANRNNRLDQAEVCLGVFESLQRGEVVHFLNSNVTHSLAETATRMVYILRTVFPG